jgi:hypothetical protein
MAPSAGVIAMGKGADVGVGNKTSRRRAVGTREHVIAHLTEVKELLDSSGMASTRLAAAVGYPGSSVAFAQLLSGMERSGLIEREVRGKRTYRITLGPAAGHPAPAEADGASGFEALEAAAAAAHFDYDELARRLLVQVVRRLATAEPGSPDVSLAEENIRLREQLRAAQRSLAQAAERVRRLPVTDGLDGHEVVLLQRLLPSSAADGTIAGAGAAPGLEARDLDQTAQLGLPAR